MQTIVAALDRLVALCAFAAFAELLISEGKLARSVRMTAGLIVASAIMELVFALAGALDG